MEQITVLIIDQNTNGLKQSLQKRPELTVVGCTNNVDIGFALAERHQPAIILLNIDMFGSDWFSSAEGLAVEFPYSSLILLTGSDSGEILRQALRVGAKEVINLPAENEHFFYVIHRVVQQDIRRREIANSQRKKSPSFKMVTFFSTKGGVGKTTLALNTAIGVRQITRKRVVLVDLNLHSGNAALLAGVPWKRSFKEVADDINNLEEEMLDSYCATHPSGLKIIPAPILSENASFIQPEHVEKILSLLSRVFNYVIIDAPTSFHDTVIPALEQSHEIFLVTNMDLASIQCLKQCMVLLKGLSMRSKVRLVVNRMGYSGGIKIKDIEEDLGMVVQCIIPECDKLAVDAVNLGTPIMISAKKSPAAQKLKELAAQVTVVDDSAVMEANQKIG